MWLSAGQRNRKDSFYQPQIASALTDHHLVESNVGMFGLFSKDKHAPADENGIRKRPNLTRSVAERLAAMGCEPVDLFHHVVAVLHAPAYRRENAGALRMDWPRVPFPVPAGVLKASADLGRRLAALLDPEALVPGVTSGALRPELRALAVPRKAGGMLNDDDMALSAGWGYRGQGGAVMPGQGKRIMREYQPDEMQALAAGAALGFAASEVQALLGESTVDVWLNGDAWWANIPLNVWRYRLGGYQVIKKWLSYREKDVLGRNLKPDEVEYVTSMARRIAAILLLGPTLDATFQVAKRAASNVCAGPP